MIFFFAHLMIKANVTMNVLFTEVKGNVAIFFLFSLKYLIIWNFQNPTLDLC